MRVLILLLLLLALPAQAQQSPEFPRKARFIIQLTGSQFASGYGQDLVPPLLKAFRRTGLRYSGTRPEYAATVDTDMDVGKWYDVGGDTEWRYRKTVTVGLSPADVDIEPQGKLSPWFSVTAILITPNPDRVDELNCLIDLAARELAARYELKGHVTVNGVRCARK